MNNKTKKAICALMLALSIGTVPATALAAENEAGWWESFKQSVFGGPENKEAEQAEAPQEEEKPGFWQAAKDKIFGTGTEEKSAEAEPEQQEEKAQPAEEAKEENKEPEEEKPGMSEKVGQAMDSVKENVFAFNRGVRDSVSGFNRSVRDTYNEIDVQSFREYMPEVDVEEFGDKVHNRLEKIRAAGQEVGNGNGEKIREVVANRLRPLGDTETQKKLASLAIQKIIANREEIVKIITSPDMSETMLDVIQGTEDYAAMTMTKGITTENIGPLLRSSFELGCAALSVYQGDKSVGEAMADVTYVVVKEGTVQYVGSAARMATEAALVSAGVNGAPVVIIAFGVGQAVQYVVHATANDAELRNDLIALTDLVVSKENFYTFMEFIQKAME